MPSKRSESASNMRSPILPAPAHHPAVEPECPGLGAPMLTRRASTPPTSRTPEVGGTNAQETCIHAPNIPHTRGWGHQCTRDMPPCPQPPAKSEDRREEKECGETC